jgi:hypothetical protein
MFVKGLIFIVSLFWLLFLDLALAVEECSLDCPENHKLVTFTDGNKVDCTCSKVSNMVPTTVDPDIYLADNSNNSDEESDSNDEESEVEDD